MKKLPFSVIIFVLASLMACDDDRPLTQIEAPWACCDCSCSSADSAICLNIVATTSPGESCAETCMDACAEHEECSFMEAAAMCPATPSDDEIRPHCIDGDDRQCRQP